MRDDDFLNSFDADFKRHERWMNRAIGVFFVFFFVVVAVIIAFYAMIGYGLWTVATDPASIGEFFRSIADGFNRGG